MTTKPATDAEMLEIAMRASTTLVGVMAPPDWEDRITALETALETALATARNDALEEAAMRIDPAHTECCDHAACDRGECCGNFITARAAIRALKEKTP
jgi:hypothetical protein